MAQESIAWRQQTSAAALLVAAGVLVYSNAFDSTFVGYNALRSVRDNEDIRHVWSLWRAMSLHLTGEDALADGGTFVRRPVLSLSFALNQALFGNRAWSYVLANLVIHVGAALLLFGLVRRTLELPKLRRRFAGSAYGVAVAVALLWLVHPLQTQSVTYFVQRAESLMGFFFLLTLYSSARAFAGGNKAWAVLAVTACALGMGTKEVMVVAPVVVYLYDSIFVCDSWVAPIRRRRGVYAALAATWILPAALLAATLPDVRIDFRPGRTWPYVLAQPGAILHYLRLSLWPQGLYLYVNTQLFSVVPGVTPVTQILLPALAVAALIALSLWGILRRRWHGFLGGAFFLILAPTSTFVATNDVLQEHRMYLPLAAVVVLVVIAVDAALRRLGTPWRRRAAVTLGASAALILGGLTHERNRAYRTQLGAYHPADLSMAQGILARYAFFRGDVAAAETRYRHALELPASAFGVGPHGGRFGLARVHNDLGNLLVYRGAFDEAAEHFAAAARLQPGFAPAHNNAGAIALLQGNPESARAHLNRAVSLQPTAPEALNNLGLLFATRGEWREARSKLETALRIKSYEDIAKNLQALEELRLLHTPLSLEPRAPQGLDDPWIVLTIGRPRSDDGRPSTPES